ncbi:spore wall protein 2-like [Lycium ferocissimum]|uniref:spore wall protein 2-like n=1 Tax=Lycium ferocissimum TaxID=112874 RepID=UPI002814F2A0|nr:spore wall protein 2-like [Lycium ferocissimum]
MAQQFVQQFQYNINLVLDKKSLINLKKKSTKNFREFAIRSREQATRLRPPLKESEVVETFIQAQDEEYYQYMLPALGKSFVEAIKIREMIEDGKMGIEQDTWNAKKDNRINTEETQKGKEPAISESQTSPSIQTQNKFDALAAEGDDKDNEEQTPNNEGLKEEVRGNNINAEFGKTDSANTSEEVQGQEKDITIESEIVQGQENGTTIESETVSGEGEKMAKWGDRVEEPEDSKKDQSGEHNQEINIRRNKIIEPPDGDPGIYNNGHERDIANGVKLS